MPILLFCFLLCAGRVDCSDIRGIDFRIVIICNKYSMKFNDMMRKAVKSCKCKLCKIKLETNRGEIGLEMSNLGKTEM